MRINALLITVILLCTVIFTSCNANDDIMGDTNQAVRFFASIGKQAVADAPETRASGTTWSANDPVGIFMVSNDAGSTEYATNKKHKATAGMNGNFTATTTADKIYYPMNSDNKVAFIAYYYYKEGATLTTPLDITIGEQTNAGQPLFDLMWTKANNAGKGYDKKTHETTPVALTFEHKLSKFVMNVTAGAGVTSSSLLGMTIKMNGMNTQNTFNLATGVLGSSPNTPAAIIPRTLTDGSVYDAIIMPGKYAANNVVVEFTLGGDIFTWNVDAVDFVSGSEYIYNVTLSRTGVTVSGTINPWSDKNMGEVTAK